VPAGDCKWGNLSAPVNLSLQCKHFRARDRRQIRRAARGQCPCMAVIGVRLTARGARERAAGMAPHLRQARQPLEHNGGWLPHCPLQGPPSGCPGPPVSGTRTAGGCFGALFARTLARRTPHVATGPDHCLPALARMPQQEEPGPVWLDAGSPEGARRQRPRWPSPSSSVSRSSADGLRNLMRRSFPSPPHRKRSRFHPAAGAHRVCHGDEGGGTKRGGFALNARNLLAWKVRERPHIREGRRRWPRP